jgi:glycerol-3-phosphate dehydrogenase
MIHSNYHWFPDPKNDFALTKSTILDYIIFMKKTIAVIGGGGTGLACAYDLAKRGFQVTLYERGELTSGTTGRHHGQLHSGARYVSQDKDIAAECYAESIILRKIAPEAIEYNQGIFIAVDAEDESYTDTFLEGCEAAEIPTEMLSKKQVLEYEPLLNPQLIHGVLVPDGTIDAYRLAMHFASGASALGAELRNFTEVQEIKQENSIFWTIRTRDHRTGQDFVEEFDAVINAGGAWAGQIAALAKVDLDVSPSPGTMLAARGRSLNMVISRLSPPGDGDILVPQRRLTIIGSTQWLADDPDNMTVPAEDIEFLTRRAAEMLPDFAEMQMHAAWCAPRPLIGRAGGTEDVRELSRDFDVLEHSKPGFFSIIGGKATVLRGMAETAVDKICDYFHLNIPCSTAEDKLPSYRKALITRKTR